MLYAVIVAGGQGTRLWPVSRKNNPKQLRPFDDGATLLQKTYQRIRELLPAENIYLATNVAYKDEFLAQLPEVAEDHLILEPVGRNNAPAVGVATAVLAKEDPQAKIVNIWADHFIENEDEYRRKLLQAEKILDQHPEYLINIPVKPEYAATGLGWLEAGEQLMEVDGETVFKIVRFVEKPDLPTAEQYLAAGNYYWNTALFVWRADTLLSMYQQYQPQMYAGMMRIQQAWGTSDQDRVMNEVYPQFEKIAIDYAISEKTDKIAILPAELGWRDVGTWQAVHDILDRVERSGVVQKGRVQAIDTQDALIFNENEGKLVAVVGMEDVVVVDTPDALLVMKKSKDQDIKKLIEQMDKGDSPEAMPL